MRTFIVALAVVSAVWSAVAFASAGDAGALAGSAAADPATARPIRLDVIATDPRGRIVEQLTAADFEVLEEGNLQSIDEARFIRAEPGGAGDPPVAIVSDADERAEAARPNTRLVAVFLDEYHVRAAHTERVRMGLARFVAESLAPQDLLVVMRPLDSLFTIRLTRDRDRIRGAIEAFSGRQGDYTPSNSYERSYFAGSPARIEQLRAQVTTSALNALALHVGNLTSDARKTLIIVSEGVPRVDRRPGLEALPTLETVTRSANRHTVSVYPVDPRDSPAGHLPEAGAAAAEDEPLRALATSTNGQAIVNVSDLGDAMRPIASDASAYYLLRYTTTRTADGKFHGVQVRVRKPGITVRTRQGYWALPSDEALRAALLRPRAPVVLEPPRRISPFIRPWFGATRGANDQTHVTFVWEPAARVPGTKQPAAARVVLKALAADGTALFEGLVLPTGPLRPDALNEPRARAEFDAPPGSVRIRMSIEDAAEQTIDSDVRDINVRDLSASVALGTPEVFRGRTARDFRALATIDAAPVSSREFSRTERLRIRVPVYAPAGASVAVAARLLNRKGQGIRTLATQPVVARSTVSEIDLPLAGFATGDYRIEIVAKTSSGEAKDVLDVRITH